METETNTFIQYRRGRNVFAFRCPVCGTTGELAVPDGNRNGLVPCPRKCGAQFMVRHGRGFFAKPTLEFAFGPGRKAGGVMKKPKQRHPRHAFDVVTVTHKGDVIWKRYGDGKIVIAGPCENPRAALARQLREARKGRKKQ